jgi:hypothetical protein
VNVESICLAHILIVAISKLTNNIRIITHKCHRFLIPPLLLTPKLHRFLVPPSSPYTQAPPFPVRFVQFLRIYFSNILEHRHRRPTPKRHCFPDVNDLCHRRECFVVE